MKNKILKIAGVLAVVSVSIFSGLSFDLPSSFPDICFNVFVMVRTALFLTGIVTLIRLSSTLEKLVK